MQNIKLFFALVVGTYSMIVGMEQETPLNVNLVSAQIPPTLDCLDDGTYAWEFDDPSTAIAQIKYAMEHGFDDKVTILEIGHELEDETETISFFSPRVLSKAIKCLKKHRQSYLKRICIQGMSFRRKEEKTLNKAFLNLGLHPDLISFSMSNRGANVEWEKIPENISFLKSITTFEVNDSGLKIVPESIGLMINVNELSFNYNKLLTLPSQIGDLANLTELDVSNNNLTDLPPLDQLKKLVGINFSKNLLTKFPEGLKQLPALSRIEGEENRIEIMAPIVQGEFPVLTMLNLQNNRITRPPQGIEHISHAICLFNRTDDGDNNNNNNNNASSVSKTQSRRKVKVKRRSKQEKKEDKNIEDIIKDQLILMDQLYIHGGLAAEKPNKTSDSTESDTVVLTLQKLAHEKEDRQSEKKVKEKLGLLQDALQDIYSNTTALQNLAIEAEKRKEGKEETNDDADKK